MDLGALERRGFAVKELIGSGSFGTVYRAHQTSLHRDVALKVVRPEIIDRAGFVDRFDTEARTIARLEHPHIVPLFEYWHEAGDAVLVMRFLRGGSLADAVQDGPWRPDRARRLFDQVGDALAVAHRHGVVHQDLKPANILLDEAGNGYLADFGIAFDLYASGLDQAAGGSPAYLAPEQIRGERVEPATDVYSLGIVLYELLTGTHPFAGRTVADVLEAQLSEPIPHLFALRPDLPVRLDGVIQRATAKAPDERYRSAEALLFEFQLPAVPEPRRRGSLPTRVASFVGRSQELTEVARLVSEHRLVTLLGVGGVGKTSLAVATAESESEFEEGAWFVDLTKVNDSALVAAAVASALEIVTSAESSVTESVCDDIGDSSTLLILDNCEHVLDGASSFADELLRCAPRLRILATSREPLHLAAEARWLVPPLGTTPDPQSESDAVNLFIERARLVDPSFEPDIELIRGLCDRLAGVPLAIELAAARLNVLTPEQLVERIGETVDVLSSAARDTPQRHQTLTAALDWSYELLDARSQELLSSLSVFHGGTTLEGIRAVCLDEATVDEDVEAVAALVDASLLTFDRDTARYAMLEPVRQYAAGKLDHGQAEQLQRRHAEFVATFLTEANEEKVDDHRRVRAEDGNIRAAMQWCLDHDAIDTALRIGSVLGIFWGDHGRFREALYWLDAILERPDWTDTEDRATTLFATAFVHREAADYDRATALLREAEQLQRQASSPTLWATLNSLGVVTSLQSDDRDEVRRLYVAAAQEAERVGVAPVTPLINLGEMAGEDDDLVEQRRLLNKALELASDDDQLVRSVAMHNLAVTEWRLGNVDEAIRIKEEDLHSYQQTGSARISVGRAAMALYLRDRGDYRLSASTLRMATDHLEDVQFDAILGYIAGVTGSLCVIHHLDASAVPLLGAEDGMYTIHGPLAEEAPVHRSFAQFVEEAKQRSPAAEFDRLWKAGRALDGDDLKRAIYSALDELEATLAS
jgi:non-specific serine/threonine protein kinase